MDPLKLLRVQVASKIAYLESLKARDDAFGEGREAYRALMLKNAHRAEMCREILADIDALLPTTNRNAA